MTIAPIQHAAMPAVASGSAAPTPAALIDAAHGFEAIFMRQLLSAMRQGKLGDDILGGSATEQFESMRYDNIADNMAQSGHFGIANMLLSLFASPADRSAT